MKILLPVDCTNTSIYEAKKAAEIARTYNCPIKFIGFIDDRELREYKRYIRLWRQTDGSILKQNIGLMTGKSASAKLWSKAFFMIHEIISEMDCSGCQIESEVLVGKSSDSIFNMAKSDNAGLIIMSDVFLRHFFSGAFTGIAISEAPCPVLVVNSDM
ncbi:MAG: universal stress protein [Oscillospiraceae bacterium]|nr:universal stress protein [Oscillospiraceae bacterium]